MRNGVLVFDEVIPDPGAYRAAALALPFQSVTLGPDTFCGIAPCGDPWLPTWLEDRAPGVLPTLSFFRQSPVGQIEPNYIHTDRGMGDWTAILYLTDPPHPDDGTTFWRHRASGAIAADDTDDPAAWRDRRQWAVWHHVYGAFNRLCVFPAPYYHSRELEANFGTGADARLVQVVFGTGAFQPERIGV